MLDGQRIVIIAPTTAPVMNENTDEEDPRPTRRMRAFDTGEDPLPAFSWPPPRRTGWEKDWQ